MKTKISPGRAVVYIAIIVIAVFALIEIAFFIEEPYDINIASQQKYWALWKHTNLYSQYSEADTINLDDVVVTIPKKSEEKRVFCLGSSSTYGAGLADRRQAFPELLNRMIPEAEVLNAGWGGYNSYQLWIYLSEVLVLLQPDIVVFYYGGNECYGHSAKSFYPKALDIVEQMISRGAREFVDLQDAVAFGTANPIALEAWLLLSESRLFRYMRNQIIRWRYNQEFKTTRYNTTADCLTMSEPTTEKIFRDMVNLGRQNGFQIIFVSEISSGGRHGNISIFNLMNTLCDGDQVRCVDALGVLNIQNDPGLFIDTSHLTPKGHAKLARLLEPEIRSALDLAQEVPSMEMPPVSKQVE